MKTPIAKVYLAIDSERKYQDTIVSNKFPMQRGEVVHPVAAEILMMEDYIARARKAWTDNAGDAPALEMVRKVAGLAVRCMENHGAPFRL